MKKVVPLLIIFLVHLLSRIQAQHQQQQHQQQRQHRNRLPFSFQSFDSTSGFPGGRGSSPSSSSSQSHLPADVASDFTPRHHHNHNQHQQQLRSGPGSRSGSGSPTSPEFQEQPRRGNEVSALPLYKQSYPGLYVKGHTVENFKYEPTTQVEHHHGPNYQFPGGRGVAQSPRRIQQQGFGRNTHSEFN